VLTVLSGIALLATNSMAHSATTQALREIDRRHRDLNPKDGGSAPSMRESYSLALKHWVSTLGTLAVFTVIIGLLTLSFWLVPVALVLAISWSLWNVITQLEGLAFLAAYTRSWRLVRPQFFTVTAVLALAVLVGSFVGGLLVALLFVLVQLSPTMLNILPGLISTVLQPFIALLLTYAYFSARTREKNSAEEDAADSAEGDDDFAESSA
jgi:flagellar biosynthesis protein FliQ